MRIVRTAVGAVVLIAALAPPASAQTTAFHVASPAFSAGGALPKRYASRPCGGQNVAPPLRWSGVPPAAQSLAVSVYDPDARGGAGLWHWVVYDIPRSTRGIAASIDGAETPVRAVTARNDIGVNAYIGPCPPPGTVHHYRFTVYALDTPLVQDQATRKARTVVTTLTPHILRRATIVATFGR
jgi:Raf kinase inhibitor-like YbhB/YbcL family protein